MYELTKAIFLLAISAPILFGVNRLTSSLNTSLDQTNSALYDATHTQTYGKGAYQDYQVRSYGR